MITSRSTTSVTIVAILSCAALLFAGNGLFQTLLPIRATQEGYSSALIGWLGTAYFGGFTIGCFLGPKIIMSVGHARTFAGITALLTATILAFPLFVDLLFWGVLRVLSGACLAMLYIVVESWLNDSASNANRGRTLSIYIIVSNIVTMAGQLLVNSFDTLDATLFILVAILICLSIVPISLTPTPAPSPVPSARLDLKALYRLSPVGVVGCLLAGIVEGAFWSLGPVFAQGRGMGTADVALLMAAFVLGGTISQWPLGWASDRIDRRIVISMAAFGTVVTGLVIGFDIVPQGLATFFVAGCHGALMIPIYALCISHANDVVPNERMVETSGGLLLSFSIGATAGPITASLFMSDNQPGGLFIFIGAILCLLGMFVIFRFLTEKREKPLKKGQFTQTSAASHVVFPTDAD
ncbi:Predicted arabinose efflux permease, MFS family [Pseudorhodobacter antarcticus]|uniref:Predicted arabinose efflux permease, MFS family n=1 Tax=Pseudorhodobacter antarcticus TaxID=1077947 RepID=A0A1H8JLY6_9RHOB|nr:MFS transporter [Pseudorhodobacter antarcticus]SEN81545.1 Predicted arabinose efflux permease, MFS family [Pseudorhodobacter antarcticus]